MDEARQLRRRQRMNIIVARVIPVILTGIIAYASWVFVGPLCVDYLINTPPGAGVPQRIAVGITLPIIYFFLLILMAVCYLRLLLIVSFDPGYIPQTLASAESIEKPPYPFETRKVVRSCTSTTVVEGQGLIRLDYDSIIKRQIPPPPGIEDFYQKDAFVCDRYGLPLWCPTCCNWKPDRSHHSSDIGRCVSKMDHFCPWVGGMVGENGYKFFVQFTLYATLFSGFTLVVMALYVAEAEQKTSSVGNYHWIVVLALAGFFGIFTFGLVLTSLQLILINVTTIENLDVGHRTIHLAVLLPPELQRQPVLPPPPAALSTDGLSRSGDSEQPFISEIDDPSHHSYFSSERPPRPRKHSKDDHAASFWEGTITYPLAMPKDRPPGPAPEQRTFAILKTPPGMNPWDLGRLHNLLSVFGYQFHEWLLPINRSPCTDHSSQISRYAFGWEFERLLADARLVRPPIDIAGLEGSTVSGGRRKRKRRLDKGWQNGERPDAWILEKEARRIRREQRKQQNT